MTEHSMAVHCTPSPWAVVHLPARLTACAPAVVRTMHTTASGPMPILGILRHWLYSGYELKELPLSVGFSWVQLYGGFAGTADGPGANRLIAVSHKQGE